MKTWFQALARTRDRITGAVGRLFTGNAALLPEDLEDLEATLLQADVPARLAAEWTGRLRRGIPPDSSPRLALRELLLEALGPAEPFRWEDAPRPLCLLAVGINGSGKTTTCAKLARIAREAGREPILGAADTFRAAGSHQLQIWADRVKCEVVAGATGGDAAAVAFDTVSAAVARSAGAAIVDTAGRMHTREPLMKELQKVHRAMGKALAGAPHEVWLVLDASMGQNAIMQARQFGEAVPLTGLVVTKLDGSAKAGFVFAIRSELKLPVRYIGLGEGADDLAPFDPSEFVDGLLGGEEGRTG